VTERRSRGLEEPLEARLLTRLAYPLLEVRNPVHRTRYLVMLPEFPEPGPALCTCTDFARRGLGTCKHIVAADRWLRANPQAPAPEGDRTDRPRASEVWPRIDRRLAERPPGAERDIRELARPGACLFEEGGGGRSAADSA
jgi:hypothetical protein